MKIFMITDLEGPAGVSRWQQTREADDKFKLPAMRLLTGEVNAAVDGILDACAQALVVVWDGHGSGGLIFEEIHPAAEVILRGPGFGPPYGLDSSFDAIFFVGQHAMAGTADAPLCHTYSSKTIEYYRINGQFLGEFGCRAALAGAMGVPTVFLAGDDKACAEATGLVPNIVTAATKIGLGLELAIHLSPQASREKIRAGAAEAIRRMATIKPFALTPPYEQEIRVTEGTRLDYYLRDGAVKIDDRTVMKRAERMEELFV